MNDYSTMVQKMSLELIKEKLKYNEKEIDVLKTYIEFSTLYEEIKILFIHKNKRSLFSNSDALRIFRYDFANKCGVLLGVTQEEDKHPRVLEKMGNEAILREKRWI